MSEDQETSLQFAAVLAAERGTKVDRNQRQRNHAPGGSGVQVIPSEIDIKADRVMLVGIDEKHILERRLQAAGCHVVVAMDHEAALNCARHEIFDSAILVSKGSLLNVAEIVFNLRDLNPAITILVLVDRLAKPTSRFLRQLLDHPIERTRILTRRQLQKQLNSARQSAPPGAST